MDTNIINKTYDFILDLIPRLEKMPRSQKFLLGDKIQNLSLEILDGMIEAYYSKREARAEKLRRINIKIEMLRLHLRMVHELKYINTNSFAFVSAKVDEIGRITGGWLKSSG